MLNITVANYDESKDVFGCECEDDLVGESYKMEIPASLIPYIAHDVCDACEDLPYDMIGKSFTLTCEGDKSGWLNSK